MRPRKLNVPFFLLAHDWRCVDSNVTRGRCLGCLRHGTCRRSQKRYVCWRCSGPLGRSYGVIETVRCDSGPFARWCTNDQERFRQGPYKSYTDVLNANVGDRRLKRRDGTERSKEISALWASRGFFCRPIHRFIFACSFFRMSWRILKSGVLFFLPRALTWSLHREGQLFRQVQALNFDRCAAHCHRAMRLVGLLIFYDVGAVLGLQY